MSSIRTMSYMDAISQAQQEEMTRDRNVVLIGEDIPLYMKRGSTDQMAPQQLWNTPISEGSFTGMAIGAAMTGLRPIVNLTIASFVYLASDQIINQAGKLRFMTGGQVQVPAVFRLFTMHNSASAAQHSDRPHPLFMNQPGLKVIMPSTPADMKGLLKSAIRDNDPVVCIEDMNLWAKKGPVATDIDALTPIGQAEIKRVGGDVTVVALGSCLYPALEAAEALAEEGIAIEVIDPRTLVPLDIDTIFTSLAKTGRLVIVDHAHRTNSAAAEIAALAVENMFDSLRKPVQRVTTPDVHIPFNPSMEKPLYPNKARIVAAVKEVL